MHQLTVVKLNLLTFKIHTELLIHSCTPIPSLCLLQLVVASVSLGLWLQSSQWACEWMSLHVCLCSVGTYHGICEFAKLCVCSLCVYMSHWVLLCECVFVWKSFLFRLVQSREPPVLLLLSALISITEDLSSPLSLWSFPSPFLLLWLLLMSSECFPFRPASVLPSHRPNGSKRRRKQRGKGREMQMARGRYVGSWMGRFPPSQFLLPFVTFMSLT